MSLALDGGAPPACRLQEQVAAPGAATAPRESAPGPAADRAPSDSVPPPASQRRFRTPKGEPRETEFDPWRELYREEVLRIGRATPNYVLNCSRNPDAAKAMWGYIWHPDQCQDVTRFPYRCSSWRCDHGCAEHERHVLYTRITDALAGVDARDLLAFVLTLDGHLHDLSRVPAGVSAIDDDPSQRRQLNLDELYRELGHRKEVLFKRLNRFLACTCTRCGPRPDACPGCGSARLFRPKGARVIKCRDCSHVHGCEGGCTFIGKLDGGWFGVVECHASGVPHLNLVIHHPRWAWWVQERMQRRIAAGITGKRARYIATVQGSRDSIDERLAQMMSDCGFGFASTCEQVKDKAKLINYCCKLSASLDEVSTRAAMGVARREAAEAAGVKVKRPSPKQYRADELFAAEITKNSQRPVMAPKGTRRHRSARNFLEPRRTSGKTGLVFRHDSDNLGNVRVSALQRPQREDLAKMQVLLVDHEQRLAFGDKLEAGRRAIAREERQPLTTQQATECLLSLEQLGLLRAAVTEQIAELDVQSRELHAQLDQGGDKHKLWQRLDGLTRTRSKARNEQRLLNGRGIELCAALGVEPEKRLATRVSRHKLDVELLRRIGLLKTDELGAGGELEHPAELPEKLSFADRVWMALDSDSPTAVAVLVESLRAEVMARAAGPPNVVPLEHDDETC